MTQSYYPPNQNNNLQVNLPHHTKVGVYVGGTTNNNRLHRQTTDCIAKASDLGWTNEQIVLFDEDRTASCRGNSEDLLGLKALIDCIARGDIKAVIVANERLFQDAASLEVNVFIRWCQEHFVFVITEQLIYDFTNPHQVKLFRRRLENR